MGDNDNAFTDRYKGIEFIEEVVGEKFDWSLKDFLDPKDSNQSAALTTQPIFGDLSFKNVLLACEKQSSLYELLTFDNSTLTQTPTTTPATTQTTTTQSNQNKKIKNFNPKDPLQQQIEQKIANLRDLLNSPILKATIHRTLEDFTSKTKMIQNYISIVVNQTKSIDFNDYKERIDMYFEFKNNAIIDAAIFDLLPVFGDISGEINSEDEKGADDEEEINQRRKRQANNTEKETDPSPDYETWANSTLQDEAGTTMLTPNQLISQLLLYLTPAKSKDQKIQNLIQKSVTTLTLQETLSQQIDDDILTISDRIKRTNTTARAVIRDLKEINKTIDKLQENVNDELAKNLTSQLYSKGTIVINRAEEFANFAISSALNDLGNCGNIFQTYKFTTELICNNIVDTLNGFWFCLGFCCFLLPINVFLSVKLSTFFRRMDYDYDLDEAGGHTNRRSQKKFVNNNYGGFTGEVTRANPHFGRKAARQFSREGIE